VNISWNKENKKSNKRFITKMKKLNRRKIRKTRSRHNWEKENKDTTRATKDTP